MMDYYFFNIINNAWAVISPLSANFLLALLMTLIGYLTARAAASLISVVLKTLQFDKLLKQVGFSAILEKPEIRRAPSELIGDVVYWLILFITVISTAQLLGISLQPALSKLFASAKQVLLAAIILGVGLFLASLISVIIKVIAVNFGIEGGKTLARLIYYFMAVIAFIGALAELGISPEVFVPQIGVIIGAFGLAAAIAFGLGCKDMAADFLHNLFKGR